MLKLAAEWQFDSPGPIATGVVDAFLVFINRIAGQGENEKGILEHFKSHFAKSAGVPHYPSSNLSWAASDLYRVMSEASVNAPLFIDAFYSACHSLEQRGLAVPDDARINRVLAENSAGYEIRDGELVASSGRQPVAVPTRPKSLDQKSQEIIEQALSNADKALAEGNGRQAVQELLWLLESIATAFRGTATATGSIHGVRVPGASGQRFR